MRTIRFILPQLYGEVYGLTLINIQKIFLIMSLQKSLDFSIRLLNFPDPLDFLNFPRFFDSPKRLLKLLWKKCWEMKKFSEFSG